MKNTLMWAGTLAASLVCAVVAGYGLFYIMVCWSARGLFC